MSRNRIRAALGPLSVMAFGLALAACASQGPGPGPQVDAPPASAPAPTNMSATDFVGAYGLASYHKDPDRARTEAAARGQCNQPYEIGLGPTGGLMMYLADASQRVELRLKAGPGGKVYIGPPGPAADTKDREILVNDGHVLILRWVDPEVAGRYGTMVFVRCTGGPPVAKKGPAKRKSVAKGPSAPPVQ